MAHRSAPTPVPVRSVPRKTGMRATTVRFGEDLWTRLEDEAAAIGVSVAQYVRDAALIRLVWEELRRGEDSYAAAAATALEPVPAPSKSKRLRGKSHELVEDSQALLAQAEQIQRRWPGAQDGDGAGSGPRPAA